MVTLIVVVSVLFIVGFIWLNIASDRNFQRRREQMIKDKIARREQQSSASDDKQCAGNESAGNESDTP